MPRACWERCLACAHAITAHGQPEGRCEAGRCDCRRFEWDDEGQAAAGFRLLLRWLWRLETEAPGARRGREWRGTLNALGALEALLGPARAEWIVAEEARRWEAETGRAARTRSFEERPRRPARIRA